MKSLSIVLLIVLAAIAFCAFSNARPAAHDQQHKATINQQVIPRPAGPEDLAVFGPPTVSVSFIDQVLCKYGSPACGK